MPAKPADANASTSSRNVVGSVVASLIQGFIQLSISCWLSRLVVPAGIIAHGFNLLVRLNGTGPQFADAGDRVIGGHAASDRIACDHRSRAPFARQAVNGYSHALLDRLLYR